jgi:subtilisin family serine protease
LIVKLTAHGPDAVSECAETLWRKGRSFRSAQRSGSEEIDAFNTQFRTRSIRAIFRRSDDSSFSVQQEALMRRGRVLTRKKPIGAMGAARSSSSEESGRRMAALAHVYRFELPSDVDEQNAIEVLRNSPGVEYVQVDHANQLDQILTGEPDELDPFLLSESSWGQPYADLWGIHRIRAPEAWGISRGENIVIAVVDTGLDAAHPDIADNVWVNPGEDLDGNGQVDPSDWNGLDDDGNGFVDDLAGWNFVGFGELIADGEVSTGTPDPFDDVGHGTHVAGIAAAVGGNGIGIAGVAPAARIMPLKGFPAEGSARDTDLWRAVLYAIEQGARVVNASWSCSPHCPYNPLAREMLDLADTAGVVFVTSAGNQTTDVVVNAPENTQAAITVGSIGFDDAISAFSNRGWLIDLVAPGGGPSTPFSVLAAHRNILSLHSSATDPIEDAFTIDDAYYRLAGTSMSAPAVSGAVALLLSERPDLSTSAVRRLLRLSTRDLGSEGFDPIYGSGALDVRLLLEASLPDLDLVLEEPATGRILDPRAGPIDILGRASGSDLLSLTLAFASGLEGGPFVNIPIDERSVGGDGLLARWDVEDLMDGPVTLRLRAELWDGRMVDEYTVFSFESNQPLRLSSGTSDEQEPSVSGNTVVWRGPGTGVDRRDAIWIGGVDRLGRPLRPRLLHASDRTQRRAIVSAGRVVWIENDPERFGDRLMSCRIAARAPGRSLRDHDCRAVTIADSDDRLDPVRFSRGRVLWSERVGTLLDVLTCRLRNARACVPNRLPTDEPATSSTRLLAFDGRTAIWTTGLASSRIELCTIEPGEETCLPIPVSIPWIALPVEAAAIDGTRLAIESLGFGGSALSHCELDLATGACDLLPIGSDESGSGLAVSGRRIAWTRNIAGQPPSIAFCEVDPVDGHCDPQRVTGGVTPSTSPSIDRNRLVWQDERLGPKQVLSTALPILRTRPSLQLEAGKRRVVPVYSHDPTGGPLALSLESVEGLEPETVGARLEAGRGPLTRLVIDPPLDEGGHGRWLLVGEGRGGWTTKQTIDVDVHSMPEAGPEPGTSHHPPIGPGNRRLRIAR